MRGPTNSSHRDYWDALELVFRQALTDPRLIASSALKDKWLVDWRVSVRREAIRVFEDVLATDGYDVNALALRRQETARWRFHYGLPLALNPQAAQAAKQQAAEKKAVKSRAAKATTTADLA